MSENVDNVAHVDKLHEFYSKRINRCHALFVFLEQFSFSLSSDSFLQSSLSFSFSIDHFLLLSLFIFGYRK